MSILADENTRVVVQGITGNEGSFHARKCIEYGTKVVAGCVPGKGGTRFDDKVPIFNTVDRVVKEAGANTALVFVPPPFAADAIMEDAEAGIGLIVVITDGIPVQDMVLVKHYLRGKPSRVIGPNCPGIMSPGKTKVGIMPAHVFKPGHVGVLSRSGTLTYETVSQLTAAGLGQSTCIGVGGDPIIGSTFADLLPLFEADPDTSAVVMLGEIGGAAEQRAAEVIKTMTKPVIALIVGTTAPPGRRMGHAGAIITGGGSTASAKADALRAVGVTIVPNPTEIGATAKRVLSAAPGGAPLPSPSGRRRG